MSETATHAVLKTLIAIAWADGHLHERERDLIESLLESSGLPDGERAALLEFSATPRTLDDAPLDLLDEPARRDVLERAVVLSFIDGHQDASERAMIRELAARLGLADTDEILERAGARARRMLELL